MGRKPSDCQSVADVYMRERKSLTVLALSIVGSHCIAEELVQESWLRMHKKGYPREKMRAILRRVVYNLSIDWYRQQKRERTVLEAHSIYIDYGFDTERMVIARQDLARVVQVLETLPYNSCLALKLHRLDGLTYREIGDRIGVNHVRAFQLVAQALARVAQVLED